ncbi:hypothetical protein G7Y89_g8360 [Cudoniella acicularis]|uniref:Uncharacterized protein n=1 Tax=Cudoniella acicularis TaxID=354080 RepID=A0A8H4RJH6_9HELO|nr:hypothetical protein G7Y89_g8360 [Cudoniella acicularis]
MKGRGIDLYSHPLIQTLFSISQLLNQRPSGNLPPKYAPTHLARDRLFLWLGEIFVSSIVARGDRVIATARNASDISHFKSENIAILDLDITSSQEGIDKVQSTLGLFGEIDVLVNNVGYIEGGPFEELPYLVQFETNFFGPPKVTRAILPHFREKRGGTVVYVSSKAGFVGEVSASAYCNSKFALEGVVESMQNEIASFGIKSILIELGFFRTRLLDDKSLKQMNSPINDYIELDRGIQKWLANMKGAQPGDPKKAVELVIDSARSEGLAKNKEVPIRLPLGSDSLAVIRAKCLQLGCPFAYLHNAGNDANFTLRALLLQGIKALENEIRDIIGKRGTLEGIETLGSIAAIPESMTMVGRLQTNSELEMRNANEGKGRQRKERRLQMIRIPKEQEQIREARRQKRLHATPEKLMSLEREDELRRR